MKKTILTLFIGFISLISFGQNAQTAIYDNLDEDNPSFSIAPGNAGSLFTRVHKTGTIVQYEMNITLEKDFYIEQVRFAYNHFGNWSSKGSNNSIKLTIERADGSLSIIIDDSLTSNIYNIVNQCSDGIVTQTNNIKTSNIYPNNTIECKAGEYIITISLKADHCPDSKFKNYNLRKTDYSLKAKRYLTSIIDHNGNFPIEILGTPICPELNVQLCSASQNFALGYDESAAITINNVENAEGELSYVWSNEETTAGIVVAPTETTTYSVTVTDANGCEGTAQHEVAVYDVAYTKEKKDKETDAKKLAKEAEKAAKDLEKGHNEVIMTHKGDHEHKKKAKDVAKYLAKDKNEWTLGTIAMQEVDFSGGDCADEDRYKTDLSDNGVLAFEEELTLNAYPNPVRNILTLESETKLNGTVKLYDLYGALLDERIAHDVWEVNLDFTHLRKGFYTVVYENNEGLTTAKRILKD